MSDLEVVELIIRASPINSTDPADWTIDGKPLTGAELAIALRYTIEDFEAAAAFQREVLARIGEKRDEVFDEWNRTRAERTRQQAELDRLAAEREQLLRDIAERGDSRP